MALKFSCFFFCSADVCGGMLHVSSTWATRGKGHPRSYTQITVYDKDSAFDHNRSAICAITHISPTKYLKSDGLARKCFHKYLHPTLEWQTKMLPVLYIKEIHIYNIVGNHHSTVTYQALVQSSTLTRGV